MTTLARHRRLQVALAAAVCLASVMLLASRLHYGFLPEDDTALSYLAERTLHGELPNVDFNDNYTGGLSYLNAVSFKLFGLGLLAPRIMLLLFFIPWIATVWYLGSRIASPPMASLITAVTAVWSVPVYPSPYGSWYNLYFATFGVALLFRYIDTQKTTWLFWTGICGGLSFLSKISALYFMAGVGLFLIFDEQEADRRVSNELTVTWSAYSVLITAALLAFTAALIRLINSPWYSSRSYHFVLPGFAISCFLIYREWGTRRMTAQTRFLAFSRRLVPFCAGVLIPVAIFLVPYAKAHAIGEWCASLLLSSARIHVVAFGPIPNGAALLSLPLLIALWANSECESSLVRRNVSSVFAVVSGLVLLVASGRVIASRLVWFSIAECLPLLIVIGIIVLCRTASNDYNEEKRLVLLLSVAGMCSLIQFPSTAPMYFCFVIPLVLLAMVGLAEKTKSRNECFSLLFPVFIFYLLFGIFCLLPGQFYLWQFDRHEESTFSLPLASGFTGDKATVELYERAIPEVIRHAGNEPIYAGPDSPEFYFLTGHSNPTTIYLDFLAGADAKADRILKQIDSGNVQTVVINHGGSYRDTLSYNPSGPPSTELLNGLRERFSHSTIIGYFEIRWKDAEVK